MTALPDAVSADSLHFGTDPTDPNGTSACSTCLGEGILRDPARPCPECHQRQQLRNAWWGSGPGPARLAAKLAY